MLFNLHLLQRLLISYFIRFHYDKNFILDSEIKKTAKGLFGRSLTIDTRDKKQPGELLIDFHDFRKSMAGKIVLIYVGFCFGIATLWWESYGGGSKELQKLIMRVESHLECYWVQKTLKSLRETKIKCLSLLSIILYFVMRQNARKEKGGTYDPICLSDIESDDE
ncbi:hypothetical protein CR513_41203, partial [Mucuna pruriens]